MAGDVFADKTSGQFADRLETAQATLPIRSRAPRVRRRHSPTKPETSSTTRPAARLADQVGPAQTSPGDALEGPEGQHDRSI